MRSTVTANEFNDRLLDKHVARKYILQLVQKFRESVLVSNRKSDLEREFPLKNETVEVALLGQVQSDPILSTQKLASVANSSRTNIHQNLKQHTFHPYKIHVV